MTEQQPDGSTRTTPVADPETSPPATDAPVTPINDPVVKEPDPERPVLGDAGKQAIDRMKAERDDYRAKLKAIEDRDLSELEKAKRDQQEMADKLAQVEGEALRNRVALAKGLPAEIAKSLSGNDEAELMAHADRLVAWRGSPAPVTPAPDPSQGARPLTPEAEDKAEYERYYPPAK